MIVFKVEDMTCGHCASTITRAVQSADGGARVRVDLTGHLVEVEPGASTVEELQAAIVEAGYTPVVQQSGT
jgi:copper chaperone